MQKVTMPKHTLAIAASVAAAALGLAACGSSGQSNHLTLVAYSTPQGAFEKLIPAFQATPEGKGVSFSQSYGPSGEQSRAVANGLHADVVNFSLEPDVERLVKAGKVSPNWNQNATHGFVSQVGRGDHRAQGQPQAHHRLVGSGQAGCAGAHAQPVHLGRRALERDGRLWSAAEGRQDARTGAGISDIDCSTTWSARTAPRATPCRRSWRAGVMR